MYELTEKKNDAINPQETKQLKTSQTYPLVKQPVRNMLRKQPSLNETEIKRKYNGYRSIVNSSRWIDLLDVEYLQTMASNVNTLTIDTLHLVSFSSCELYVHY